MIASSHLRMSTPRRFPLRPFIARFTAAALLSLSFVAWTQAAIDHSVTQRIWKTKYGVDDAQMYNGGNAANGLNTVWMNEDADGDGVKNGDEIAAGTNPFNRAESIAVTSVARNGSLAELQFPTKPGKLYRVESTTALTDAGSWLLQPQPTPVQVIGDGGNKTLSVPYVANSFYRIRVDDFDADGDGVSDWAELTVTLNPALAETVVGVNDHTYVTEQLELPSIVTIKAGKAFASEDGPEAGWFTVVRTQNLFPITVNYGVGGTALPGIDYASLSGLIALNRGVNSSDIFVNPMVQPSVKGGRSVTATLAPPPPDESLFALGAADHATVIINDSTAPTGTGLLARYYDTSSGTYADAANFGQASTYNYTRTSTGSPNVGNIVVVYTAPAGAPALLIGHFVRLSFTGGNLNTATYNHQNYPVTAVTATDFTVGITGASLPTNSISTCHFSIQDFTHPAVVERVDPTVNFDWIYGTPNAGTITPNNSPDGYSTVYEGYLTPTTAGAYNFQLDADDKARVLLDLNDGNGLQQIVEHGWDVAATVGTFKPSAAINLVVPTTPAERYRIRVEHVETTGDARCRLQWRLGTAAYANIPQANVFTHTAAMGANYNYTRTVSTPGAMSGNIVVTLNGHGYALTNQIPLYFTSGNLFTPANGNFHGTYEITAVTTNTFTVNISGANLPASGTGAGLIGGRTSSTTTGWLNLTYANTTFAAPPGRIAVDASGATTNNNGIWGSGSPAPGLIQPETFSARWTGQVQPQFTEEYTFVVHADDGCALWINGQPQQLKTVPSTNQTGSTYTYDRVSGNMVINYAGLIVLPNSFVAGETIRLDPASGNLTHAGGSTYSYDGTTGDAVIDYANLTNITAGSFVVGEIVELDPTGGNLTTLGNTTYVITAVSGSTFTVNFGTGVFATGTGTININDTRNGLITAVTPTTFTVNVGAGKYAASSTGNVSVEIINKALKDWSIMTNERFIRIPMIGGVRYDIRLESFEGTGYARCQLSWYSPSQPKQIIPSDRLYPSNGTLAPATVISPTDVIALVGGAFTYNVAGSNGATVSISGNPAWLTYNAGVLSGTPPAGAGGDYQIVITLTGAAGTATSVVNLHVEENAGIVVREAWNGIAGTSLGSIPVNDPPTGTSNLTSLEAPVDFGDNYGARMRGYITAPVTGNYYFWIAGSNAAELWISNDHEPVNAVKRAWIVNGTGSQSWSGNAGELDQKSPWLALEAGQKYYFEVLHKAGAGSGDNVAVGWLRPGQSGSVPSEVVPGYVLSPWAQLVPLDPGSVVYSAILRPQGSVITNASGVSYMRVNAAETEATLTVRYSDLSSAYFGKHVHNDMIPGGGLANVIADLDEPGDVAVLPDGTFHWVIKETAGRSVAQLIADLKAGKLYFNVHSTNFPGGEIKGYYSKVDGSQTFTPPAAPPTLADDHTSNTGAVRFLTQATFGPNIADVTALKGMASYEAWINSQFTKPATLQLPEVLRTERADAQGGVFEELLTFNAWWKNSISGDDQLRQRIAFSLSEILVVSGQGPLDNRADALSYFYDKIAENAFGSFRDILEVTTLTPTMGRYLDMLRNDKPDLSVGRIPNENYAREIKQLFSIGLFRMWPDGTLVLNSKYEPIETYTQREIVGFAHAFTGWDYGYDGAFRTSIGANGAWMRQMREVPARHFTGPKRVLNNEVLPGLPTLGGQPLDPYANHTGTQFNDPAYQNLSAEELDATHDQLFNHPNVGPFICRQLIQRLVTSHPSRGYLYRVVQKFNDNGSGERGDMKAVIKAILLDYEARHPGMVTEPTFGKQREPVLRVAVAGRTFRPATFSGTYSQTGTQTIAITTTTPHLLASGNSVFLNFDTNNPLDAGNSTTDPAPWIGAYAVSGTPGSATTFNVTAQGLMAATYNQPAGSNTVTITVNNHWLQVGHKIYADFTTGTAHGVVGLDNAVHTLVTASPETGSGAGSNFTITDPGTAPVAVRTGTVLIPRFNPGSYTTAASGLAAPNDRRVTMDTNTDHDLKVGDQVQINFYGGNPQPVDMVVTVDTVVDVNTWTFLATATGTNLGTNQGYNSVYQFPLVAPQLNRAGVVGSRPSTFALNSTDGDINQSPLNSPTVFNFYLPDYKFPGIMAAMGLTTPEFQETAETTVVRQANFLFSGIFNPTGNNVLSSFRAGSNALVMDFNPWLSGNAADLGLGLPPSTKPWTNNENVSVLIDQLSTLLVADQLSTEAKTIIRNFVAQPITSITTHASACTVTTSSPHGLLTGNSVVISGVNGGTFGGTANALNNTSTARTITVTGPSTFTIPLSCTVAPNGTALSTAHVSVVPYNNGVLTPAPASATQKRDRLRAIIHLILTSPDYTIQR